MTKKYTMEEASKIIAEKVTQAEGLIRECEDIADEYGLDFTFGPAYGMGGTYYAVEDGWRQQGWNPSSQNC